MSKPKLSTGAEDPVVEKNFAVLRDLLCGKVSLTNCNIQVLQGTTSTTLDTAKQFIHSMNPRPVGWFPLVGDVYVQSIDSKYIDIRSTKPDVNFKIILIGGEPVTGEGLISTGGDSYQDTQDIIDAEIATIPDPTTVAIGDVSGLLQAQIPLGTTLATNIVGVATDGTYFYITSASGTAGDLIRLNRTDGTLTLLSLGAIALGPMKVSGTKLYVCARVASAGTLNIYEVNTSTFTLTTTHAGTSAGTAASPIIDFAFDSTNFYICTSTATPNSRLHKFAIGGGACTILSLSSSGSATGRAVIVGSNGFIYATEFDTGSSAARIYKIDPAGAMSISTTITTSNRRWRLDTIREISGTLLIPAIADTSKSATSQSLTYGAALLTIDMSTNTITENPIPLFKFGQNANVGFAQHLVINGTTVYGINASLDFGTYLLSGDTTTFELSMVWYPLFAGTNNDAPETVLIQDTDGAPIMLYKSRSSADLESFMWFKP